MDAHDAVTLGATFGGIIVAALLGFIGWLLQRAVRNIDEKLDRLQNGQASHSRRLGNIELRLGLPAAPPLQGAATGRHREG